ncbi:MAG: response regulator [Gammaproteobacteria bacterium]
MKTALIIDDSRLARAVLRKTLVGFGIEVDEVPSAEAAIEYLKVDSPDVIFLDHMMPGMDGFDTLSALKANPSTATIPVLMYTSQEGQFYTSQARALGAIDVLSKDLAPADVERLLRSHHLIEGPGWTLVEDKGSRTHNQHELIEQFRTMLDERTVSLMAEIRRELGRTQLAYESRLDEIMEESRPVSRHTFSTRLGLVASVASCALLVAVGLPLMRDHATPEDSVESFAMSMEDDAPITTAEIVPAANESLPAVKNESVPAERPAMPVVLAKDWNVTRPYPYGALPLDDVRAQELALLFAELTGDGFSGTVTFEIHEGRYCINYSSDGSTQLAPPDLPATSCDYISAPASSAVAALQSPMFKDVVASVARDGRINVDMVLHGADEPIIEYPALGYAVTAAHWNAIADMNQRVSIRVSRDDDLDTRAPVAYLAY